MKSIFPLVKMNKLIEKASTPVDVEPNTEYVQIGIRSHGKGLFDKDAVSGTALGNKRVFWVEPDCLIINIVFAWEQAIGKTSCADVGKIVSHRFPMYRPKSGKVDVDYLVYLFKTRLGKHLLTLASPGGAGRNKTLGQIEFSRIEIPCPPLAEQKRIAEILSTWDRAIEATEKLIASSEAQKKALMQQLLSGKKRLPGFGGEWGHIKLEELAKITMGSSPPSASYNEFGDGLPLIQGNADVKNRLSAPRIHTKLITQTCLPDDILFSVRAPVGQISVSLHHACIGRGIAAIKARSKADAEFLYYVLLMAEPDWVSLSQGSTFQAVNSKDLKSFTFLAPVDEIERQMIGHVIGEAQTEENLLQHQLGALRQEKSALMQQLLTGKRRVKVHSGEKEAACA